MSRVFHKNTDVKKTQINHGLLRMNSIGDDLLDYSSLPPLMDPSYGNTNTNTLSSSSTKSQSDGYYLPTFSINNNHQLLIKPENHTTYQINPTTNNNNTLSQQHPQIGVQNQNPSFLSDYFVQQNRMKSTMMPTTTGFVGSNNHDHHEALIRAYNNAEKNNNELEYKQCKMEQFSSNHSQDTGLSNDTSSVVSKQQDNNIGGGRSINNRVALYEDLEGPSSSSVAPLSDLECLWDY